MATDRAVSLDFYRRNYRAVVAIRRPEDSHQKILLGDSTGIQRCRFCGRTSAEATFRLEAHAIPEAAGNKWIFTRYECDACNRFFGRGIENDFGNWSKAMRLLTGRRGKRGIPTLKGGGSSGWRIERKANQFSVIAGENDGNRPFSIDEEARTVTFDLPCDPFVPVAVLKALVKMGLSIVPAVELPNFGVALAWIANARHQDEVDILAPVLSAFTPAPELADAFTVGVLCRRPDAPDRVPYAFFLLTMGNQSFQVILPSPEQDAELNDVTADNPAIPPFPWAQVDGGEAWLDVLDLSDTDAVRDATVQSTFQFQHIEVSDGAAPVPMEGH